MAWFVFFATVLVVLRFISMLKTIHVEWGLVRIEFKPSSPPQTVELKAREPKQIDELAPLKQIDSSSSTV
jgi:hypothetical protein